MSISVDLEDPSSHPDFDYHTQDVASLVTASSSCEVRQWAAWVGVVSVLFA